jgi:hypothetical protein
VCIRYRGKNKLISGSQFRTLVRDTDAPSTCSECEGQTISGSDDPHSELARGGDDADGKREW